MALEKELATYHRELQHLLPQEGKYVLIHGDEISGIWDTYEDALKAGYDRFKLSPFMVKRIQSIEQVHSFTRDIAVCHNSASR